MTRDPFAGLPTSVRLWLGCALCVLPLGVVWSVTAGSVGYLIPGTTIYPVCTTGPYCPPSVSYPPIFIHGSSGSHALGAQADARLFLVFAALVLAYAAVRRRTPFTRRLVRAATAAMVVAAVLAVARHAVLASICLVGGLALVTPLVWPRPVVPVPAGAAR